MEQKLVLVTGGAGLIGSRLCGRLLQERYRVISLDNYFAGSRDNHIAGVEYREGHTKDIAKHVVETPDLIYHLGEYARVEQSLLEPEVVHDLNVLGTQGVLDYWREKKCKLVYAGSSTKFGDEGRTREATPYASTKAANSEKVKAQGEQLDLPYAVAYFYNVYGPGERAGIYGTVIEAFKQMYLRGTPLTITAPGTQLRNFTHVDDIVDGLILIGEKGKGDEYGLGNERAFTILEVARLFGSEIIMLPEREGNRMQSSLDTSKSRALGWHTKRTLEGYIAEFLEAHKSRPMGEHRVLVFSTTFYPIDGPAEKALIELIRRMPAVQFDVVAAAFSPASRRSVPPVKNVHVHWVGSGRPLDKYLLPILGYLKARKLNAKHKYFFAWSLMASYAALSGVLLRRTSRLPLLITLADQNLEDLSVFARTGLKLILSDADQVYGAGHQEHRAKEISGSSMRRSMGEGDAFANQLRYSYTALLKEFKK